MKNSYKIRQLITEITKPGPRSDWTNRIGLLFDLLGGQAEKINWNGSPEMVTAEIVSYFDCRSQNIETKLNEAIQEYSKLPI